MKTEAATARSHKPGFAGKSGPLVVQRMMLLFFWLVVGFCAVGQTVERTKMPDLIASFRNQDSLLIVNFWATWCQPCVEELPFFHDLARRYKERGVKLILVSLDFKEDFPHKIQSFAAKQGYDSQLYWLDETDADYFCPMIDSAWNGAIPSTLIISPAKGYRWFFEGKIKPADLESTILQALKQGGRNSAFSLNPATHTFRLTDRYWLSCH